MSKVILSKTSLAFLLLLALTAPACADGNGLGRIDLFPGPDVADPSLRQYIMADADSIDIYDREFIQRPVNTAGLYPWNDSFTRLGIRWDSESGGYAPGVETVVTVHGPRDRYYDVIFATFDLRAVRATLQDWTTDRRVVDGDVDRYQRDSLYGYELWVDVAGWRQGNTVAILSESAIVTGQIDDVRVVLEAVHSGSGLLSSNNVSGEDMRRVWARLGTAPHLEFLTQRGCLDPCVAAGLAHHGGNEQAGIRTVILTPDRSTAASVAECMERTMDASPGFRGVETDGSYVIVETWGARYPAGSSACAMIPDRCG